MGILIKINKNIIYLLNNINKIINKIDSLFFYIYLKLKKNIIK